MSSQISSDNGDNVEASDGEISQKSSDNAEESDADQSSQLSAVRSFEFI